MNELDFNRLMTRYIAGFGAALSLSVLGYLIATTEWLETPAMTMATLLGLAFVQFVVQLVCFLHVRFTGRSKQRTVALLFTLLMMFVIIIGSLWIMKNLDYRMGMSSSDMNKYMLKQNKKGF